MRVNLRQKYMYIWKIGMYQERQSLVEDEERLGNMQFWLFRIGNHILQCMLVNSVYIWYTTLSFLLICNYDSLYIICNELFVI